MKLTFSNFMVKNADDLFKKLWYNNYMDKKAFKIVDLKDKNKDDLKYWLSRPAKERIEAVEFLRKQFNGNTRRLQRVIRVIQQT